MQCDTVPACSVTQCMRSQVGSDTLLYLLDHSGTPQGTIASASLLSPSAAPRSPSAMLSATPGATSASLARPQQQEMAHCQQRLSLAQLQPGWRGVRLLANVREASSAGRVPVCMGPVSVCMGPLSVESFSGGTGAGSAPAAAAAALLRAA